MAEATKKRKGTALLAVMDENCSSCAGSPICEAHCPVDDCINLVYEELPGGGLKPYRVFVDNDKCIGCQMCYSDDLTKVHQHKETGEIFYEYDNKFWDSNRKPVPPEAMPKKFQLQLIGTESEDRLDKKICPWDAIKMVPADAWKPGISQYVLPIHDGASWSSVRIASRSAAAAEMLTSPVTAVELPKPR